MSSCPPDTPLLGQPGVGVRSKAARPPPSPRLPQLHPLSDVNLLVSPASPELAERLAQRVVGDGLAEDVCRGGGNAPSDSNAHRVDKCSLVPPPESCWARGMFLEQRQGWECCRGNNFFFPQCIFWGIDFVIFLQLSAVLHIFLPFAAFCA